jgi:hypothetical protein
MARVVDRLLAQLPGLRSAPAVVVESPSRFPTVTGGTPSRRSQASAPSQSELIGVWVRVMLGLSLGIMMARWPYARTCGLPLFGYFSAVLTVTLAGIWAAASAWRFRSGLAHIVALILMLYGLALTTAELLPRTGYAVDRATWVCDEAPK